MNDFDLDAEIKSARKSTSRSRRRELNDDVVDSPPQSRGQPIVPPRRGSKSGPSGGGGGGGGTSLADMLNDSDDDQTNIVDGLSLKPSSSRRHNNNTKTVSGWSENEMVRGGGEMSESAQFGRSSRRPRGGDADNMDMSTNFDDGSSAAGARGKGTQKKREFGNDEQELEIPEIPDLDEAQEPSEDITSRVAEAPDIQVHQISTYKELDKEFFKEKAFQFLEGNIDVSLLHCGLSTQQEIAEEEDIIWEWNRLFTEVVSLVSANQEESEAADSAFESFGVLSTTREAAAERQNMKETGGVVKEKGSKRRTDPFAIDAETEGILTSRRDRPEWS